MQKNKAKFSLPSGIEYKNNNCHNYFMRWYHLTLSGKHKHATCTGTGSLPRYEIILKGHRNVHKEFLKVQ